MKHAYKIGHVTIPGVRTVDQYDMDGNFIKRWSAIKQAARELGIESSSITKCCKGKLNKTGGFKWKYVERK